MRVTSHGAFQFVAIFLGLAIGVATSGYLYYDSQKQMITQNRYAELYSIAELKVNQISDWRKDRLGEASIIGNNIFLAKAVQDLIGNPGDTSLRRDILIWMNALTEHGDYDEAFLTDSQGNLWLSTIEGGKFDSALFRFISPVRRDKTPFLSELYISEMENAIRLCLFVPILDPNSTDHPVIGVLLLTIDPHKFLYPLIQSWPTPSSSSETLLVLRDGDEVLFLNELKHSKNTALTLRYPVKDALLPSARAVQWEEGVVEGIDYRKVPVLASIRGVKDTRWFLVAKVDMEEVYVPLRERARLIGFTVAILIGASGVGLALVISRHQQVTLRKARDQLELCVDERTRDLSAANEALKLDESRMEVLLELSQMSNASDEKIMDFALNQQVILTGSTFGSLGFMNEDETVFTRYGWSQGVEDHCNVTGRIMHQFVERAGLWADSIRKREPIIVNDYYALQRKVFPEGHIPITRFMSIPVLDGERIVAVALVANKPDDYNSSDVRQITLLLDGMWRLIQRQRAEKALRDAESLSAMGRALSSVAHDMKTPLIAIGGFTQMVHRHLEDGDPNRAKLEIVVNETRRLENMVKDMLDFSRPLALERSLEDINGTVLECIAVVEVSARERKIEIQTDLAPNPPLVLIDCMRMKQVLINLAMNAVQASPEGTRVIIGTRGTRSRVLIDIIDQGCGIPPENREEIFLPFVSHKKDGTGLGLAIVKKIVEAHAGEIRILDNPERKGVTFRLSLPTAA